MRANTLFFGVMGAPLIGVSIYLWLIGQFDTLEQANFGSALGFLLICWIIAMVVTLIIGFPLGFAVSYFLRRVNRESLHSYLLSGGGLAIGLAIVLGDPTIGTGFVVTALILALTYWFSIAKDRVNNGIV